MASKKLLKKFLSTVDFADLKNKGGSYSVIGCDNYINVNLEGCLTFYNLYSFASKIAPVSLRSKQNSESQFLTNHLFKNDSSPPQNPLLHVSENPKLEVWEKQT